MSLVTDSWTSRVISSGSDPYGLGRWSYIILRGSNNSTICLITAYRVCLHRYTGPKTAYQQQTRYLSFFNRQYNINTHPEPHRQFILDLQSWIETLIDQDLKIILTLDNNDEIQSDQGGLCPLTYQAPKPTVEKQYDGSLESLMKSTGLVDILAHQHPSPSYPATYNHG